MSDEEIKTETPPAPHSKSEIIREISKILVDRRTARSLSLEKVSQNIKIRLPYLQAIEKGEWTELPGEVYVRGFIRRYAQSLGIDGDKLIAPYIGLTEMPTEKKSGPAPIKTTEFGKTQLIWGFLGVLFIIGFLKVIKQDRTTPVKPASASQEAAPRSLGEGGATAGRPDAVAKSVAPQVPLESHLISVYSPLPLWLRVTANDKNFEGFIPQASTWTWKGEGVFTVRLGHTKEVAIIFDGKPVPLVDDQKKVILPAT